MATRTSPSHNGRPLVLIRKHSTRAAHVVINTFNFLMAPADWSQPPEGAKRPRREAGREIKSTWRPAAEDFLLSGFCLTDPHHTRGRHFPWGEGCGWSWRGGQRSEWNNNGCVQSFSKRRPGVAERGEVILTKVVGGPTSHDKRSNHWRLWFVNDVDVENIHFLQVHSSRTEWDQSVLAKGRQHAESTRYWFILAKSLANNCICNWLSCRKWNLLIFSTPEIGSKRMWLEVWLKNNNNNN